VGAIARTASGAPWPGSATRSLQRPVALLAEFLQPFLGERLAGALFDQPGQMGHGLAEEDLAGLRRGQRGQPRSVSISERTGHQWLGIDQYAVAVEQHGIKGKRDI
jgi:hypothetical protein